MPNFYFLVRFLAHKDSIVRSRVADLFLEHKANDDAIPGMVIHAVRCFGMTQNLPVLRLLPYQDLSPEQLEFFLSQREKLQGKKKSISFLEQYDAILKKILISRHIQTIKLFLDDLPAEFLKTIYLKKWRHMIHRDLFKVYSAYPPQQILDHICDYLNKYKKKSFKRVYLSELRIWSEVFYVNFTKIKDEEQKRIFFEYTENYFGNLTKNSLVHAVKKRVYSLEACYHLLNAAWWSMDHLLKEILDIFTLDCDNFIYEETVNCLLEFDENSLLPAAYDLLISHRVTDKAFPYLLKLFYLPGELEENDFKAKSEELLLSALKLEKNFNRRVYLCLTLSNLFSSEFLFQGAALLKNKTNFNFSANFGKTRVLLQERLLVHSLLTGEKVEGIDTFINRYIEKKPEANRLNPSLFFYKKRKNGE